MATLRTWWDRLLGRTPEPPAPSPPAPGPHSTAKGPPTEGGSLELLDAPPKGAPQHPGAAGFDPYGNDAGFTKPHSWERIDHD